jgi:dTDP-glucose pyrophosphorylase
MPEIYLYDLEETVFITPEDFVKESGDYDITELIEALIEEGHLPEHVLSYKNARSISEEDFEIALTTLHGKYHSLTKEEGEMINSIARRVAV